MQALYTNTPSGYTSTAAVAYPATAGVAAGSAATAVYADPYQQAALAPTAVSMLKQFLSLPSLFCAGMCECRRLKAEVTDLFSFQSAFGVAAVL